MSDQSDQEKARELVRAMMLLVLIALLSAIMGCNHPSKWSTNSGRYQNAFVTTVYQSPIEDGTDVYRIDMP
jgi:hypothetical protein